MSVLAEKATRALGWLCRKAIRSRIRDDGPGERPQGCDPPFPHTTAKPTHTVSHLLPPISRSPLQSIDIVCSIHSVQPTCLPSFLARKPDPGSPLPGWSAVLLGGAFPGSDPVAESRADLLATCCTCVRLLIGDCCGVGFVWGNSTLGLISSDNETFNVEHDVATRSVLIKNMIEGKQSTTSRLVIEDGG